MGFFYIQILSVFDCLPLIVLFCEFFSLSIDRDLLIKSNAACIILSYLIRVTVQLPSWIQVLMTYERFISVVYPNKFKFTKSKSRLALVILGIVLFIMVLNSINFWFYVQQSVNYKNLTSFDTNGTAVITLKTSVSRVCLSDRSLVRARDMMTASFRSILPFTFMLIGNVLLIRALVKSKKKTHSSSSKSSRSSMRKEVQFTISILAINMLFMIVYLPLAVTLYISGILAYNPSLASATFKAGNALAFHISLYIAFLNNSLPLLINLKFNHLFRKEFYQMIQISGNGKTLFSSF